MRELRRGRSARRHGALYPLHVRICDACFLVQLRTYVPPEDIFTEYACFSPYSSSWLEHAPRYADMITERLRLRPDKLVVELGSNDGCLLQAFIERGIPALGIEPAGSVAEVAVERGVPTVVAFFGADTGSATCRRGSSRRFARGQRTSSPRCPTSTTSWRG